MKNLKNNNFISLLNSYLIDSPQPVNISYLWNFSLLLRVCLVIQIITGITLAMYYTSYLDENLANFFFLFVTQIQPKYLNKKKKVQNFLNSFDIVKGLKHASSFPLLPFKLANYHNSLMGRTLRVIGGLSAYILLTYNTELSLFDSIPNKGSFLYYLVAFIGLSHLFYMFTIFTVKLGYVIYHILKGDWIHRNSP